MALRCPSRLPPPPPSLRHTKWLMRKRMLASNAACYRAGKGQHVMAACQTKVACHFEASGETAIAQSLVCCELQRTIAPFLSIQFFVHAPGAMSTIGLALLVCCGPASNKSTFGPKCRANTVTGSRAVPGSRACYWQCTYM